MTSARNAPAVDRAAFDRGLKERPELHAIGCLDQDRCAIDGFTSGAERGTTSAACCNWCAP
jgi:hypothetical protein